MQEGNNHTDKLLREIDNRSLPDLSQADKHWQAMKTTLQSPAQPGSTGYSRIKKWSVYLAAVLVTGIVFFFIYQQNKSSSPIASTLPAAGQDTVRPKPLHLTAITTDGDTLQLIAEPVTTDVPATPIRISTKPGKIKYRRVKMAAPSVQLHNEPMMDAAALKTPQEEASLEAFFKQLEKPAQEFVIDNARDTMIHGKEGSAFFVPARCFNTTSPITFVLKEYYSYQDMITNRLTTTSNGRQLISGGMVQLVAMADGKELSIANPQKSIRWFIPDTSAAIQQMQLFTGQTQGSQSVLQKFDGPRDSLIAVTNSGIINWTAQLQRFGFNPGISAFVKDMRDMPFKTRGTRKGKTGVFYISAISDDERDTVKALLKEKYGYRKVVLKREHNRISLPVFRRIQNQSAGYSATIGDSVWIRNEDALRYNLPVARRTTTLRPLVGSSGRPTTRDSLLINGFDQQFGVEISTLGWINCDRFYNDPRRKIDYIVQAGDSIKPAACFAVLVFDKLKSLLPGTVDSKGTIRFVNVPEGETARVMVVAIRHGKTVSAVKETVLSAKTLTDLSFTETTAAAFKQEAGKLD